MAANGVLEPLEEQKAFNCHYKQKISTKHLIRRGDERNAIPEGLKVGRVYEERKDFAIERGFILPDLSPGLSTFSELNKLPKSIRKQPGKLWMLEKGTPFPEELEIDFERKRKHAAIKPRDPMKKERLEEVTLLDLNCDCFSLDTQRT